MEPGWKGNRNSNSGFQMAYGEGNLSHDSHNGLTSAPLFERIESDEYVELKACRQARDALLTRVSELERINMDLELRLEEQAKQVVTIEYECMEIERRWRVKCEEVEGALKNSENKNTQLEKKGERLREQISRTERELYGILQRKYELMRTGGLQGGRGGGKEESNDGKRQTGYGAVPGPLAAGGRGLLGRRNTLRTQEDLIRDREEEEFNSTKYGEGMPAGRSQRRAISGLEDFLGL